MDSIKVSIAAEFAVRGEGCKRTRTSAPKLSGSREIEIWFPSSDPVVPSDTDSLDLGETFGELDFLRFFKKLGDESVLEPRRTDPLSLVRGVLGRTRAISSSESDDENPFERGASSVPWAPSLLLVRADLGVFSPEDEEEFLGGSGLVVGTSA